MIGLRRNQPERVAVLGAGVAGLSTAWFLQELGVSVSIFDRGKPGSGSSRGNAGWLVPGLVEPLPSPGVLKNVLPAMLRRSAPLRIPLVPDFALWRFLAGSARHCTSSRWRRSMGSFAGLTPMAFAAFDTLRASGVDVAARDASPFLACFRLASDCSAMAAELEHIRAAGQPVESTTISGNEARAFEPCLSEAVTAAIAVTGQQFLDPMDFVSALASSVDDRGATLRIGEQVTSVEDRGHHVVVSTDDGGASFDAAVLATGAWLSRLAKPLGVRIPVHAGRGYSFGIDVTPAPTHPLYFPTQRVACTPVGGRLRVAGMMEFRDADAPFDARRSVALARATAPMLTGVDVSVRHDEWVGSRPCTADGLPLIGATRSPRVFVYGGHGMWGMVLGPVSGRLLAELVTTGEAAAALGPFDPARGRAA
jgi:D-amino-acid dehydrogenase